MVLLLQIGTCYEAEIFTVLLPLRYAFAWHPSSFTKVKLFISGRKPWIIVRRFDQICFHTHNSSLEVCATCSLQKEAIFYAWDLLTDVYKLPKDRMYISYFGGDEALGLAPDLEARQIWLDLG